MRKIRTDLVGVVMAGGRTFAPGDEVPEGIDVHDTLVEAVGAPESNADASKASESTEGATEPESGTESTPEGAPEDFSDLLSEEAPAEAPAPKTPGRKPAARKS